MVNKLAAPWLTGHLAMVGAQPFMIEGQSPKRLSGRVSAVGYQTGMPLWGMVLFGFPFAGAGGWITLMSLGILPIDESNVHAPMWVLTVCGLVFLFAGIMIWAMAGRQMLTEKRRRQQAQWHPNEPAMADYLWDRDGFSPPRWKPVFRSAAMTLFITVFLSVFNWWAFWSEGSPLMVKVIVGVFNLFLVLAWWQAIKTWVHALKFGKTRLIFSEFPFRTGGWFQAEVQLPSKIEQVERAQLVFRCVREFYQVSGHGKNRRRNLVHEQLWSETQNLSGAEIGRWPRELKATFVIPTEAPATQIAADQPLFWELEMELEVPGINLKQRYLVPVYTEQG